MNGYEDLLSADRAWYDYDTISVDDSLNWKGYGTGIGDIDYHTSGSKV